MNPLGMQLCDLNDFASDSTTWSVGGATRSDSSSEFFLRFEDCLAFGSPRRFPDFVVVAAFESNAALFDLVSKVDFPFPFATGAVGCGRELRIRVELVGDSLLHVVASPSDSSPSTSGTA